MAAAWSNETTSLDKAGGSKGKTSLDKVLVCVKIFQVVMRLVVMIVAGCGFRSLLHCDKCLGVEVLVWRGEHTPNQACFFVVNPSFFHVDVDVEHTFFQVQGPEVIIATVEANISITPAGRRLLAGTNTTSTTRSTTTTSTTRSRTTTSTTRSRTTTRTTAVTSTSTTETSTRPMTTTTTTTGFWMRPSFPRSEDSGSEFRKYCGRRPETVGAWIAWQAAHRDAEDNTAVTSDYRNWKQPSELRTFKQMIEGDDLILPLVKVGLGVFIICLTMQVFDLAEKVLDKDVTENLPACFKFFHGTSIYLLTGFLPTAILRPLASLSKLPAPADFVSFMGIYSGYQFVLVISCVMVPTSAIFQICGIITKFACESRWCSGFCWVASAVSALVSSAVILGYYLIEGFYFYVNWSLAFSIDWKLAVQWDVQFDVDVVQIGLVVLAVLDMVGLVITYLGYIKMAKEKLVDRE